VSEPRRLLVVFHSRSGGTQAMADAVVAGATDEAVTGVDVRVRRAPDAGAADVRWCDAIVLGTPENFGYMSGLCKDFLERIYYVVLDETAGLPYGLFVKGGHDGEGAIRSVERIVTGLRWKQVLQPVLVTGDLHDADLERCRELGLTIAAGLEAGIFSRPRPVSPGTDAGARGERHTQ
jgi:multimeric flavodoxin WrbA